MPDILHEIGKIYKENSKLTDKYYLLCHRYALWTECIVKITIYGVICILTGIAAPSWFEYFVHGNVIPSCNYYVSYHSDEYEDEIMAFVTFINYGIIVLGGLNLIAFNSLIYTMFINVPLPSAILAYRLNELSNLLVEVDTLTTNGIRKNISEIILMYDKYYG